MQLTEPTEPNSGITQVGAARSDGCCAAMLSRTRGTLFCTFSRSFSCCLLSTIIRLCRARLCGVTRCPRRAAASWASLTWRWAPASRSMGGKCRHMGLAAWLVQMFLPAPGALFVLCLCVLAADSSGHIHPLSYVCSSCPAPPHRSLPPFSGRCTSWMPTASPASSPPGRASSWRQLSPAPPTHWSCCWQPRQSPLVSIGRVVGGALRGAGQGWKGKTRHASHLTPHTLLYGTVTALTSAGCGRQPIVSCYLF